MSHEVVYCQINKDYAYWTEKRRVGQKEGGHVCGLLTHLENGEVCQKELVGSKFLHQLKLKFDPEGQKYGAYLLHYSGWEDLWGMLSDEQLTAKFQDAFPDLFPLVRVAERGQTWKFN